VVVLDAVIAARDPLNRSSSELLKLTRAREPVADGDVIETEFLDRLYLMADRRARCLELAQRNQYPVAEAQRRYGELVRARYPAKNICAPWDVPGSALSCPRG